MRLSAPLTVVSLLYATTVSAQAASTGFDPVSSGFRVLWGLLVVLAIIFGLYLLLRKRLSSFQQQGKGDINILEVKHVMPKKTLLLIEVKGQHFLAGGGGDSINTIVPLREHGFDSVLKRSREKVER